MGRPKKRSHPVTKAARAATAPLRLMARVERTLRVVAPVLGVLGVAMLAACAVLWVTPEGGWPEVLARRHLAVYVMVSLVLASLIGWTFVEEGQRRVRLKVGTIVGFVACGVLPVVCAVLSFAGASNVAALGGPPPTHFFWSLVRWYSPVLVVVSLVAFLKWKSRGKYGRGVWFVLLVAPYAMLLATIVFGVPVAGIDEAHRDTLRALGAGAVALQLALAFFVGTGS